MENIDELQRASSLLQLATELRALMPPSRVDFELTDSNRKDEFRAIIGEMRLEWEKVEGDR